MIHLYLLKGEGGLLLYMTATMVTNPSPIPIKPNGIGRRYFLYREVEIGWRLTVGGWRLLFEVYPAEGGTTNLLLNHVLVKYLILVARLWGIMPVPHLRGYGMIPYDTVYCQLPY